MSKREIVILTVVITILVALVIWVMYLVKWVKKIGDNITFDINLASSIRDILSSISGGLGQADIAMTVDNKNNFSIPVSGLYAEVYYKGELVAHSTTRGDKIVIPANGSITVTHNITAILSGNALEIGKNFLLNNSMEFTYKVSANVYGIGISHTDKFNT